jgi:hypothetical protein
MLHHVSDESSNGDLEPLRDDVELIPQGLRGHLEAVLRHHP